MKPGVERKSLRNKLIRPIEPYFPKQAYVTKNYYNPGCEPQIPINQEEKNLKFQISFILQQ